ncbi:hypothetical protein [Nocardia caishijiensis]|nr:hypothetical protein [Nocardia caishijiensis]
MGTLARALLVDVLPWGLRMGHAEDVRPRISPPDVTAAEARRAMRAAGAAGLALGAALLACSLRVVVSGLDSPYLLLICVVGAVPGVAGLGLIFAAQQLVRGKSIGVVRTAVILFAIGVLVALGCAAAISQGPWIARIVMGGLACGTVATGFLLYGAHRALRPSHESRSRNRAGGFGGLYG